MLFVSKLRKSTVSIFTLAGFPLREASLLNPSQFENHQQFDVGLTPKSKKVFPFIRQFRGDDTTYSDFMRDARLSIPTPALLSKLVDLIDLIPMTTAIQKAMFTSICSAKSPLPGKRSVSRFGARIIGTTNSRLGLSQNKQIFEYFRVKGRQVAFADSPALAPRKSVHALVLAGKVRSYSRFRTAHRLSLRNESFPYCECL